MKKGMTKFKVWASVSPGLEHLLAREWTRVNLNYKLVGPIEAGRCVLIAILYHAPIIKAL